jgi:hypothetical protein
VKTSVLTRSGRASTIAFCGMLASCFDARAYPGAPCAADNECPSGLECIADRCVLAGTQLDAAVHIDARIAADAPHHDAPGLTAAEVIADYDMEECTGAFACESDFPGSTSEFTNYWGATVSDCDQNAAAYDAPSIIAADVASGEIHFDPVEGASCIAGLGYTCSTFWADGPTGQTPCEAAITGTVADGGACHIDWDCVTWTSYCDTTNHQCTAGSGGPS